MRWLQTPGAGKPGRAGRRPGWCRMSLLSASRVRARHTHRAFLPWWAAAGGCRLQAWLGMDVKPPVHVPEGGRRFADPAWSENPAFCAVRQGYLAASQLVSDPLAPWAGDLAGAAKARLAAGFLLDALAPTSSTRPA